MYSIRFVNDDDLPAGHDFVLVAIGEDVVFFFRSSAVTPQTLEEAWAAFRAFDRPAQPLPRIA